MSQGDMAVAAAHSRLFVAHALNLLAQNFAAVGDYGEAASLFDEGLLLDPGDVEMRLDYVRNPLPRATWRRPQNWHRRPWRGFLAMRRPTSHWGGCC